MTIEDLISRQEQRLDSTIENANAKVRVEEQRLSNFRTLKKHLHKLTPVELANEVDWIMSQ